MFLKDPNIKVHGNLSSGNHVEKRTDRWTDMVMTYVNGMLLKQNPFLSSGKKVGEMPS
jgi:hypothetical protein